MAKPIKITILGDATDVSKAVDQTIAHFDSLGTAALASGALAASAAVGVGVALFKIGDSFDEAYDKIRVGTGKTGEALDGLKDDFREVVKTVPTDFGSASDAISFLNEKFGSTGEVLQGTAEDFLELSRITKTDLTANMQAGADALTNWGISADDSGEPMNELFRLSQSTGIAFADLATQMADGGIVLRSVGFDFDHAAALLGALGKAGVDTGDVMPALSKAMASAAKEGKSASDVFAETVEKIKSAPDDAKAAGDAMAVFGAKAGPKMAALIREGKLGYDDLLSAMQNGTDTIRGAGEDTQDFGEKWELIKNRVLLALEPVATKVFDTVGKAMDALGPKIDQLSKWFNAHLPQAIAAVQPWVERIASALFTIGRFIATEVLPRLIGMGQWLADHKPILEGIAVAIGVFLVDAFVSWAISAAAAAVATIAAAIPVLALGAAIALLTAGIIWVVQNFDIFRDAASTAFTFVQDKASAVIDWLGSNWDIVIAILTGPFGIVADFIYRNWDSIISFLAGIPGQIAGFAGSMWDGLKDGFFDVVNAIIGAWNSIDFGIHLDFEIPSWVPGVGGKGFHFGIDDVIPDIPYVNRAMGGPASGVIRLGERGPEDVILPRGSTVVPAHASGRGTKVDVHVQTNADPYEIGDAVAWAMRTSGR